MIATNFNPGHPPGSPPLEDDDAGSEAVRARIWKCAGCGAAYGYSKPETNPGICALCGGSSLDSQDIH